MRKRTLWVGRRTLAQDSCAPAWPRPSRPVEAPEQRSRRRGFGRGLSNHTTVTSGRASPSRSRMIGKERCVSSAGCRRWRAAQGGERGEPTAAAPHPIPLSACGERGEGNAAAPDRGGKDAAKAAPTQGEPARLFVLRQAQDERFSCATGLLRRWRSSQ